MCERVQVSLSHSFCLVANCPVFPLKGVLRIRWGMGRDPQEPDLKAA